jgi:hypothetical protein
MGKIPSVNRMVSAVITNPQNGQDLDASTTFEIEVQIKDMQLGAFTNAQNTYYSAPQDLNGQGQIIGHTHVTVQDTGNTLNPTQPLDPTQFAFFKGINDNGNGQGRLTAEVAGGLPTGCYRVCTMSSASNHQPILMPVAQRGAQDDCRYFSVGGACANGGGGNNGGNNGGNGGNNAGNNAGQGQGNNAGQGGNNGGNNGGQGQGGNGGNNAGQGQGNNAGQGQGGNAGGNNGGQGQGGNNAGQGQGNNAGQGQGGNNGGQGQGGNAGQGQGNNAGQGQGGNAGGANGGQGQGGNNAGQGQGGNAGGANGGQGQGGNNGGNGGGGQNANAVGGAAPAVEDTGDTQRPFSVNGNTFATREAAVQRSCAIQNNACADAVNGGQAQGQSIATCNAQEAACRQAGGA